MTPDSQAWPSKSAEPEHVKQFKANVTNFFLSVMSALNYCLIISFLLMEKLLSVRTHKCSVVDPKVTIAGGAEYPPVFGWAG